MFVIIIVLIFTNLFIIYLSVKKFVQCILYVLVVAMICIKILF